MFMKFKFKPAWIGLFLIAIMLFSTFAYAIIQSFYPRQNVELPKSNIIDYRFDPNLKSALIQYGATIITFDYNLGCENCATQKSILEFFANEYKPSLDKSEITIEDIYGKIILEELLDGSLDKSKIIISSTYGEDSLIDANETDIFNSLCKLMVAPPVACALQKT